MTDARRLGTSDLIVSPVGLGCNNFGRRGTATEDQAGTTRVVHAALDAGITLLDTADMYGQPMTTSETLMGPALTGIRDQVVLATKFGHQSAPLPGAEEWGPKGARAYVRNAVEGSLRRLQTDWIDLYQLHTPDPETAIGETIGALAELIQEGKVRFVGHSNLSAAQIDEADAVAKELGLPAFVSAQDEYSLVARGVEAAVLPAVVRRGLGFLPYFPLGNGLLTGKYTRADQPADGRLTKLKPELLEQTDWARLEQYQAIADANGVTMLQATFAWMLAQPAVTSVIAGATRVEQIAQNASAGQATLSAETVDEISDLFS